MTFFFTTELAKDQFLHRKNVKFLSFHKRENRSLHGIAGKSLTSLEEPMKIYFYRRALIASL